MCRLFPACLSLPAVVVLFGRPIETREVYIKVAGNRLCVGVPPVCRGFCDDGMFIADFRGFRQQILKVNFVMLKWLAA
jgi:hypothetical protein